MSMINYLAILRPEVSDYAGAERPLQERVISKAVAVQKMAEETLQPFIDCVSHQIGAAKALQERCHVGWATVRTQRVALDPLDTLLEATLPITPLVVLNWPAGRALIPGAILQVVSPRSLNIPIDSVEESSEGPIIRPSEEVLESDLVWLEGVQCQFRRQNAPPSMAELTDADGGTLAVRLYERFEPRKARIVVTGVGVALPLQMEGRDLDCRVLPASIGLGSVRDAQGGVHRCESTSSECVVLSEEVRGDVVTGDNGVRFKLRNRPMGRKGHRVKLEPPDTDDEWATLDPRDPFFEENIGEVWTAPRRADAKVIKILGGSREDYTLILENPPERGSELFLPLDVGPLVKQRRALSQLLRNPLPHHRPLLRLAEDREKARWSPVPKVDIGRWYSRDIAGSASGAKDQQEFVKTALGTPDFAFLEGPPGSGKTTAIVELILQLIHLQKRVLLCSTTHTAVDNVLERLAGDHPEVVAIRIGKPERASEEVQPFVLKNRVAALLESWKETPLSDHEKADVAERIAVNTANLTCGTTIGVLQHPLLRQIQKGDSLSGGPAFDVLIIDEASRATFQEFLVPAMLASKWVIVGDVHQLPPFTDRGDLEASLSAMPGPRFPLEAQRAAFLAHRLSKNPHASLRGRPVLVEKASVLRALMAELAKRPEFTDTTVIRIVRGRTASAPPPCREVSLDDLRAGKAEALLPATADILLVEPDLLEDVLRWIPADGVLSAECPDTSRYSRRHSHWIHRISGGDVERHRAMTEEERGSRSKIRRNSWSAEVAWRIARIHELKGKRGDPKRMKLEADIEALLPRGVDAGPVRDAIWKVHDVALPGVIETLQEGADPGRERKQSGLSSGLTEATWRWRSGTLPFQHRMHPTISDFPRDEFYKKQALRDSETVSEARDRKVGWTWRPDLAVRRVWDNVRGSEVRGVNREEISAMEAWLRHFLAWAAANPRKDKSIPWEVACLAFYLPQQRAIRDMIRRVTQLDQKETQFKLSLGNVIVSCGTVDRFQGREADLVLLSLRNTKWEGFLNSPNRLNVGITRARFALVILGYRDHFLGCSVEELRNLAKVSPPVIRPGPARI